MNFDSIKYFNVDFRLIDYLVISKFCRTFP